jgi:diphthine synthase
MLCLIGIGLRDEKDISLKGLEIVKKSDVVYLENYTSKLSCSVADLEELYEKKIILADREIVEQKAEETILKDAQNKNVAFLVIGDVFGATTHVDLMLRAKKLNIKVKIIHNVSILTAVGVVGLELYKYGKVTSIPFENKDINAPLEVINQNKKNGLHTLVLLDLRPDQDKFMTINEALGYLIEKGLKEELKVVGCAGIGSDNAEIKFGKIKDIIKKKFTQFPQCLIFPGTLHFMEEESLELYKQ